jgi:hypothetical protein
MVEEVSVNRVGRKTTMAVDSWVDNHSIHHTNKGLRNICQDNREHKVVQESTEDTIGPLRGKVQVKED